MISFFVDTLSTDIYTGQHLLFVILIYHDIYIIQKICKTCLLNFIFLFCTVCRLKKTFSIIESIFLLTSPQNKYYTNINKKNSSRILFLNIPTSAGCSPMTHIPAFKLMIMTVLSIFISYQSSADIGIRLYEH